MGELRPDLRLEIMRSVLGGQVLSQWWDEDYSDGRAYAVGTHHEWGHLHHSGRVTAKGVDLWFGRRYDGPPADVHEKDFQLRERFPDFHIPWKDVAEVVRLGATPERRERYSQAYAEYCEDAEQGRKRTWVPLQKQTDEYKAESDARGERTMEVIRELNAAGRDIVEVGCAKSLERAIEEEPLTLF